MPKKQLSIRIAVAYLRRSDKNQDASIERQRKEVERYAAEHGYNIIDWYSEDVSGTDTSKRAEFLRLIERAKTKKDFQYLLTWRQDRAVGRIHHLEAASIANELYRAGITLVTTDKGEINWDDFMVFLMSMLTSREDNAYSQRISSGVTSGMHNKARLGGRGGAAPYGYKNATKMIEGVKIVYLEPGDPLEVKTVKRIFREFTRGKPLQEICDGLDADGIPNPSRKARRNIVTLKWKVDTLKTLLQNEAYMGDTARGKESYGKFNSVTKKGAQAIPNANGVGSRTKRDRDDWLYTKNTHKPLVTREVWNKAQEMLEKRKRSPRKNPNHNIYRLSGLCVCGKCGYGLCGHANNCSSGRVNRYMICITSKKGSRDNIKCEGTRVREAELYTEIERYIREVLLGGIEFKELLELMIKAKKGQVSMRSLPKPFKEIKKLIRPIEPETKVDKRKLDRQIASLKKDIERRTELIVSNTLDSDELEVARTERHKRKEQLEKLEAERNSPEVSSKQVDNEAFNMVGGLVSLCLALRHPQSKNAKLEEAINTIRYAIKQIVVHTEKTQGAKSGGNRNKLTKLEVEFNRVGITTGDSRIPRENTHSNSPTFSLEILLAD